MFLFPETAFPSFYFGKKIKSIKLKQAIETKATSLKKISFSAKYIGKFYDMLCSNFYLKNKEGEFKRFFENL